jgi:hypothetical protein
MMDIRKLSQMLIIGGIVFIVLAVIWWMASYSSAFDMSARYSGDSGSITSCLYSSSATCSAWAMFGDSGGPSYSPAVFWIGVIALLAGVVMRFVAKDSSGAIAPVDTTASAESLVSADGKIMGFIPAGKYVTVIYVLMHISAVIAVVMPLSIIGFIGLVLALLGLFVFKQRLSILDLNHLPAICFVYAAAFVLSLLVMGSGLLQVVVALLQLALYYVGFNSYRHARTIGVDNIKAEAQLALKHK